MINCKNGREKKSKFRSPSTATIKPSSPVSSTSQPQTMGQGRITKKYLKMYRLVFMEDVLSEQTTLSYYV